jgi:hypothetical protein
MIEEEKKSLHGNWDPMKGSIDRRRQVWKIEKPN